MTVQGERVAQTQATMDLFAAFAKRAYPDIGVTLRNLCDITDPLAAEVLNAIHAERRRRMSAATREERRG